MCDVAGKSTIISGNLNNIEAEKKAMENMRKPPAIHQQPLLCLPSISQPSAISHQPACRNVTTPLPLNN
jgi:hypothetical protein